VNWRIEALAASHERGNFTSGIAQLDLYIQKFARQHSRKDMGRTYVAVEPISPQVLGYYTLSASSVSFASAPKSLQSRLPRYPLPTARIGKLAVDRAVQGQGLGEFLLLDALRRTVDVAGKMAIFAVEVDAIDGRAKAFYVRYGFQSFEGRSLHLFLPVASIKSLF